MDSEQMSSGELCDRLRAVVEAHGELICAQIRAETLAQAPQAHGDPGLEAESAAFRFSLEAQLAELRADLSAQYEPHLESFRDTAGAHISRAEAQSAIAALEEILAMERLIWNEQRKANR